MKKKYSLNENYFEEINSEDKAYFLGLLYADGYNNESKSPYVRISLQEQDKHILEDFQNFLESNCPITIEKKNLINKKWSNICRFQICRKKISQDLSNLGCYQNKTKSLKFPTIHVLPENLQYCFIRGYFDGDGSVWQGKRKFIDVKDLTRKEGHRIKIVHNVKFNITGTESMMLSIQNILIDKLGFKKNKLNRSKNIENCVQLEYSGRLQMKKFYDFIYNNSTVHFNRKKKKFEEILNLC